jgi:uncharacterized tellurite resistance protein B-like protein
MFLWLALAIAAEDAAAKRGFRSGSSDSLTQELVLVSETRILSPNGEPLSVCKMIETETVFFLNFSRRATSFGLAENRCDTDTWYPLVGEELEAARRDDRIARMPGGDPALTLRETVTGYWGWALVVPVLGVSVGGRLRARQRRRAREAALGGPAGFASRLLDVMCHAAIADGHIDQAEIRHIQAAATQLTGEALSETAVREAIASASSALTTTEFQQFGRGLSLDERKAVFKGAFLVMCGDGLMAEREKDFLGKLAGGLRLEQLHLDEVIASLGAPDTAAPTA